MTPLWKEAQKNNFGEGPYVDEFEPGPAALPRPICSPCFGWVNPVSVFHWSRAAWNVIEHLTVDWDLLLGDTHD